MMSLKERSDLIISHASLNSIESSPLILWIKAGSDKERQGGDPLSHSLFIILLSTRDTLNVPFEVRTVSDARIPSQLRQSGIRRVPAVSTECDSYDLEEDIVSIILREDDIYVDEDFIDIASDLMRHFSAVARGIARGRSLLHSCLSQLNSLLSSLSTSFIDGDSIGYVDALILSRIHSIQIASKALFDMNPLQGLNCVRSYLERGYGRQEFIESCPSDQEIILYWAEKNIDCKYSIIEKIRLSRDKQTRTLTIK